MFRKIRLKMGIGVILISLTAMAMFGAYYLGKLYIGIVKEGSMANSKKVFSSNSRSVAAPAKKEILSLNPVPVYFLQVGVYSDSKSAKDAARPFVKMGLRPYITASEPYKLWIGVYKNRKHTEFVKSKLRDKGYGSFTGALVVNGSGVTYSKGSEGFVKEITPLLEQYTLWLKENLEMFHAESSVQINWDFILKQETVVEQVYQSITGGKPVQTNNETINSRLSSIQDNVRGYKQKLLAFKDKKSDESYFDLQFQFLNFVDNYQLLLKEIDNISKT